MSFEVRQALVSETQAKADRFFDSFGEHLHEHHPVLDADAAHEAPTDDAGDKLPQK